MTTLNAGQQAAADGIFDFLLGNEKELVISGPGGTGKTHLMGHIIDEVLPMYHKTCSMMNMPPLYRDVYMTATTNKAADVLGSSTGRPTSTIYSLMNLKVEQNLNNGSQRVTKTKSWMVHRNKIIFVDEASFEDSVLRNYILEGTNNCKIIHVGDHCQLAPIMEQKPPVFSAGLPFYELTEQMRTSDANLQGLNQQLRHTVETGEFLPIQHVPGVIDWVTDEDEMQALVEEHFVDSHHNSRLLAYTNDRVNLYNGFIRDFRQLPSCPVEGDILVCNSAIQLNTVQKSIPTETQLEIEKIHSQYKVTISPDVELDVLLVNARSQYALYENLEIPVDREHFNALTKWYAGEKNWERYFYLKNTFPDLRPADACTTHKAQGSTFDTVFIDMGDMSNCRNPDTAARLLYVAASRARKRVIMFGHLAQKFGGII
ncbi:hypothetical protein [Burkholderia phage vB_BpP_HN02]|uniref:UvrD-like helicase C-terminal domain-containing protein n=1 Tax=Burkholderia phage vB_BpP_HN02 TaxID=3116925 RepID=A0AAX4JGX4_9CAUD